MCTMSLREKILGTVGDAAQKTPLPTYILNTSTPFADKIEVDSFYEIDHTKLPPRSPTQLHSVRVVKVTAKTELNVTVGYPGTQSLDAYFGNMDCASVRLKLYPTLDEKFVMGPKLAIEVLGRQIPSTEFAELKHSKTFWVIGCVRSVSKAGELFSKLQGSSIKGWGSQRMIAYFHDPKQLDGPRKEISEVRVKEEKQENQETDDIKVVQCVRKRKPGRQAACAVSKKKIKRNSKPKLIEPKSEVKEHEGGYIDRWPVKRYEAAATKLLEVLKANHAIYGNPISRFKLRKEARGRIGDTGLLDHLLKHLAGKVLPGQNERLRRRCDSEGTMEYWLESKDLLDIRKEAGVQDPYWTPPPGWKPGDSLSPHNCLCCQQVRLLKEELSGLRGQIVELKSKNEEKVNSSDPNKDTYASLLKKKSIMEEQLLQVSRTLKELKGDMNIPSHQPGEAAKQESHILTNTNRSRGDEMSITREEEEDQEEEEEDQEEEEEDQGELSESDGEKGEKVNRKANIRSKKVMKMKRKLKPCDQQEYIETNTSSPMDVTPASASPLSTTTS